MGVSDRVVDFPIGMIGEVGCQNSCSMRQDAHNSLPIYREKLFTESWAKQESKPSKNHVKIGPKGWYILGPPVVNICYKSFQNFQWQTLRFHLVQKKEDVLSILRVLFSLEDRSAYLKHPLRSFLQLSILSQIFIRCMLPTEPLHRNSNKQL